MVEDRYVESQDVHEVVKNEPPGKLPATRQGAGLVGVDFLGASVTRYTGCDGIRVGYLWGVVVRFCVLRRVLFYPGFVSSCENQQSKPVSPDKPDNVQLQPSGPPGVSGFQLLARLLFLRSLQGRGGEGRGREGHVARSE